MQSFSNIPPEEQLIDLIVDALFDQIMNMEEKTIPELVKQTA
jgi:hypothetical protein